MALDSVAEDEVQRLTQAASVRELGRIDAQLIKITTADFLFSMLPHA